LMSSRTNLAEDLALIQKGRSLAPDVRILLLGGGGSEAEFLQYVRAGIKGYLMEDASVEDVLGALKALQCDQAVCPGALCAALFRYFEKEATTFPSAAVRQRLGLTRREQQLIPLVARGMTNKEIANHFCLSEQTVKNHLYRMKQKVSASDRLGIVQVCRTQGFLVLRLVELRSQRVGWFAPRPSTAGDSSRKTCGTAQSKLRYPTKKI